MVESHTLALASAPQTFNYYGAIDWNAFVIMGNILDSLLDANPVTQEIEPGLVKKSFWDWGSKSR